MKPPYTSRQGQFLAFIHYHYTNLHGRPPAEAEMAEFFQVTPPSAHLILTLERRGLITRAPGEARSIRLKLPPEQLPHLHGTGAPATIPPPAHQIEGQPEAFAGGNV